MSNPFFTHEQTEFLERVSTFEALHTGDVIYYCHACDCFASRTLLDADAARVRCPHCKHRGYDDQPFAPVVEAPLWPRDHGHSPLSLAEALSFLGGAHV